MKYFQAKGQAYEKVTLDAGELQEALDSGKITRDDFDHAYRVHDQIKDSEWVDVGFLQVLCQKLLLTFDAAVTFEFCPVLSRL